MYKSTFVSTSRTLLAFSKYTTTFLESYFYVSGTFPVHTDNKKNTPTTNYPVRVFY